MKMWKYLFLLLPFLLSAQNVGIGIATPTEKLHIAGNLRLDNAFMPGNNAGTTGQVLISQGAGNAPIWTDRIIDSKCATPSGPGTDTLVKWTGPTSVCKSIVYDNGNQVTIGTTTPAAVEKFTVQGDATYVWAINGHGVTGGVYGEGGIVGVYGFNYGTGGTGVFGITNNADAYGGRFEGGANRSGVIGYIAGGSIFYSAGAGGSFTGSNGIGVYGRGDGANGHGVLGIATTATAFGAYGINTNASGTGVVGAGNNVSATYLTSGTGVAGSSSNVGVFGYGNPSNANSTGVVGVEGEANGIFTTGIGSGGAFTGNRYGVYAWAVEQSSNARAIVGVFNPAAVAGGGPYSYDGYGVLGIAANTTSIYGYGVVGQGNWYGVYAIGDLGASGAKAFMIDHPLDPENKWLKHFAIEAPEVLNMYRGTVTLDANGEAVVKLPHYFSAINKDFSYHLTAIGSPAPNIYVKEEINTTTNTFKVAGGAPGQKISWTVYAKRNDPYMQKYPEKGLDELSKKPNEVGKYAMPELYDQPAEKGLFYLPPAKKVEAKEVENKVREVKLEDGMQIRMLR